MKKQCETLNIVIFVCVYISSIVGAGFASGQEIYTYFSKYKFSGMLGMCLFFVLLLTITIISNIAFYNKTKKSNDWHYVDCAAYSGGYALLLTKCVVMLLSFGMMCIMVSGLSTLFANQFNFKTVLFFFTTLIFVLMSFDFDGIKIVGAITTPIIIVIMLFVVFSNANSITLNFSNVPIELTNFSTAMWNAMLYAGYNLILPIVICSEFIKNKASYKTVIISSIIAPIIVFLICVCINGRLITMLDFCKTSQMPLLDYAYSINKGIGVVFKYSIAFAMLSSALVSGFSLSKSISNSFAFKKIKLLNFIICLAVMIVASCGFVWLINNIYPVLGIGGALLIVCHLPGWINEFSRR